MTKKAKTTAKKTETKPSKTGKAVKAAAAPSPAKTKLDKKSAALQAKSQELISEGSGDEDEDEMEAAPSSRASSSGAALAAAAATSAAPEKVNLKNFRHHPDLENFYRFIVENDLRVEALEIIDMRLQQIKAEKSTKGAKSKAH